VTKVTTRTGEEGEKDQSARIHNCERAGNAKQSLQMCDETREAPPMELGASATRFMHCSTTTLQLMKFLQTLCFTHASFYMYRASNDSYIFVKPTIIGTSIWREGGPALHHAQRVLGV
jgi:hypothetical protein